jgi:hypothetical protein
MSASIRLSYQRLMGWYPSEWRDRNEEAMLGALLDHAQAQGLTRPSAADGFSLRFGGLKERVFGPNTTDLLGILGIIAATGFALFYVSQTLSRGPQYSGFVGPFANPSVIAAGLFVSALAMMIARKARVARGIIFLACVLEFVIGIAATISNWQGPSIPTVAAFVGLGLFAIARPGGVRRAVMLFGAVVLLWIGCEAFEAAALSNAFWDLPFTGWTLGVGCVSLAGAAVLAWPWRTMGSPKSSQSAGTEREAA